MSSLKGAGAIWAGMAAPVLFVCTFMIEGCLRAGYDSRTMYISALALGPRGWVQILNFVVFGLLLMVFARGIAAGASHRIGPALLAAIGFGCLLVGPFVMDAAGTPRNMATTHGWVHHIASRIVLLLMPVSCFALVRSRAKWRSVAWCTIAAGTTVAIAVALLAIATMVPSAQSTFAPWSGLLERTTVVLWMAWLFLFALAHDAGPAHPLR